MSVSRHLRLANDALSHQAKADVVPIDKPQWDWVDNQPIREAVERAVRNGLSYNAICKRLGWTRPDGSGETSRLRRRIGAMPHIAGNGERALSLRIRYDLAVLIADAIEADPIDVGL